MTAKVPNWTQTGHDVASPKTPKVTNEQTLLTESGVSQI